MRPTKFRAWDKENHRMLGPWGLGDVFQRIDTGILPIGKDDRSPWDDTVYTEELIWLEFTGLHDKNGKDIYEGDIIQSDVLGELIVGKVLYADGWASFFLAVTNKYGVGVAMAEADAWYHDEDGETKAEVIGNIYENPGLLENNHAKD